MVKVEFVDLRSQYYEIKEEIDQAILDVIEAGAFIGGKFVEQFERQFCEYAAVKHCVGVGNGTDAIFIVLKALGIMPGDEVITAANSFIATSEAITLAGATPRFVDCDASSYNIDVSKIPEAINRHTRCIIPVHLYGQPADMTPILKLAEENGLFVIADAAQAHGAYYKQSSVASLGVGACYSFYPGKNLGAYGDAGAIVTNDGQLADRMRMYANHGRKDKYIHEFEGINSRLDGIQAAVLSVKLRHLESWIERRRYIAARYSEELSDCVRAPEECDDARHVYHLYVIRVPNRDKVRQDLADQGISTGIHYPVPLPLQKAYRYLNCQPSDFPVSHQLKEEILSLPIHGNMQDSEIEFVTEQVNRVVAAHC